MNSRCDFSEYKDERHDWHGPNYVGNPPYRLAWCGKCKTVRVQKLVDERMGSEVWETVMEGQG